MRRRAPGRCRGRGAACEAAPRSRAGSQDRATRWARRAAAARPAAPARDAMTTRCFSPPLRVENEPRRRSQPCRCAASAARAMAEIGRVLRPRTHPGAGSGPSARARAPCSRRPDACSAAPSRCAGRPRAAAIAPSARRRAAPIRRVGASTPASSLSSVVLPDPFGPRMPTRAPDATSSETSRTTGRPGEATRPAARTQNERLRAEINTDADHAQAARRGVAEGFFVLAIEQVEAASEDLDVAASRARRRRHRRP